MESKTCTKCKRTKPLDDFPNNKNSKDGKHAWCKICGVEAQREFRKNNPEYHRSWKTGKGRKKVMLTQAKRRAAKQGVPFDLTESDFEIPEVCPILGMTIVVNTGIPGPNSAALDKIVPELGYVAGNVQVLSMQANMMKSYANTQQLLMFADWIYKMYGDNI